MSIKSLFGLLVLSALSNACGVAQADAPEELPQPVCDIAVQSSNVTGLKTTATIVNNGSATCSYTVQFGIVVDDLETFGVYWNGNLAPNQRVSHQQIFEFDTVAFDVGDQCSQYYVLVTDPRGTRMTTADCS